MNTNIHTSSTRCLNCNSGLFKTNGKKSLLIFFFILSLSFTGMAQTTLFSQNFTSNDNGLTSSGWTRVQGATNACAGGNYAYFSSSSNYSYTSTFHVGRGKGVKVTFSARNTSGTNNVLVYARVGGAAAFATSYTYRSGWMQVGTASVASTTCSSKTVDVPGNMCGGQDLSICFVASAANISIDDIVINDGGPVATIPNIGLSPWTANFDASPYYFYGPVTYSSYYSSTSSNVFAYRSYQGCNNATGAYAAINSFGGNYGKVNSATSGGHAYITSNTADCSSPGPSSLPSIITKEFNTSTVSGSTATLRFAFKQNYSAGYTFDEDYTTWCPRIYYATTKDAGTGYTWTQATVNYYFPNNQWWYAATSLPKAQNIIVAFCPGSATGQYNFDDIKVVNDDCAIAAKTGEAISTVPSGLTQYALNTNYTFTIANATTGATHWKWIVRDLTTSGNPFYYGTTAGATPAIVSGQGTQTATINFGTNGGNTYRVMCIPYDGSFGTDAAPTDACYAKISIYGTSLTQAPCALNGPYTVGGTTPDFATFTDVATALNNCGVSGPVTFNVRTGTYTESISLNQITGASATNTITFQSESGNQADVTLTYASNSTVGSYTVQLNGTDYTFWKNMTISRTGTNSYANVIRMVGDASYNTFDNVKFAGKSGDASSINGASVASDDNNTGNNNNIFKNSYFLNGTAGVWIEGSSGSLKPNFTFQDNTFETYRYGLYLKYMENVSITGNTMVTASSYNSASTQGIYAFHVDNDLTISGNTFTYTSATNNTGIELQACFGTVSKVGNISNNMIVVGSTGTVNGINSGSTTSYKNYYYNSIYNTGSNATSSSCFYLNGSSNINFKNNNLFATVGNAIEILAATAFTSDYNNLYSTGTYVGYWGADRTNLSAWQTASSQDANSISANPSFISATDLHCSAGSPADAKATPISGITVDIDGDTRNATTPDIGADEFTSGCPVPTITLGSNPSTCYSAGSQNVNLTYSATTGTPTTYSISGWSGGSFSNVTDAALPVSPIVIAVPAGTVAGTYTATLTVKNACANVSADNSISVTVNAIPSVSSTTPGSRCGTGTVTLGATASTGTLNWYAALSGGPSLGTGTSFTTPSISSTTPYYVDATNNGCTSSPRTSVTATVNSLPAPGFVLAPTPVCLEYPGNVYSTQAGYSNYVWNITGGSITSGGGSGDNTATVTWNVVGAKSISINYSDANNCTAITPVVQNVTVNPLPDVRVSPASAVCTGTTHSTLTATVDIGSTYVWSPNLHVVSTNGVSNVPITVEISQLTFYTVTGTNVYSCTASKVVPVATVPVGGVVTPRYSIICSGGSKALTADSTAGNSYQWQSSTDNLNWTPISGATTTNYTALPATGTYYRLMAKSNACWDVASSTALVNISQPDITLAVAGKTDNSVVLNWTPVGGGNYNINYDGTSSGSASNVTPPYTISGLTGNGTYNITVTQTGAGLSGCPASGDTSGVTTLCASPTGVTLSSPANKKLQVDWTGDAGNYRVYYREVVINGSYLYKDVTTTGNSGTTTISVMYSGTYEAYVVRKDCPSSGVFGQKSVLAHVSVKPLSACTPAPAINYVKSTCPGQIEVSMSGSPTGNYVVFIQRLTPTLAGAYKYNVSGGTFQLHVGQPGQTFAVGVASKCVSGTSDMVMYPGGITIKPLCNPISNLVLSNRTCYGFTASWNRDVCSDNQVSNYQFFMKKTGALTWNSYQVASQLSPFSPHLKVSWLSKGNEMSCYVKSNYTCNGYVIGGPSSTVEMITTLSAGCREEGEEMLTPETPSTQIIAADNSEAISIYPNPNGGQFQLDISRLSNDAAEVRVEVMNVLGQTVLTRISEAADGHGNEIIYLPESCAAGTYFVRVTVGSNIYTAKVNVSK